MREILNSHSVANLKKEISKTNIKGYSKLKKAGLVDLMLKHKDRFSHIKPTHKIRDIIKKYAKTKDSKLVKKAPGPKKKTFTITKASGQKVVLQSRKKTKPKKRRRSTPYLPTDESGGY